jgi:threonine-phosphate decarboxylase
VAAVRDEAFIDASRRQLPQARRRLVAALEELGLFEVLEGAANYLLLDAAPSGLPAARWAEAAAARGILLRDASRFPGLTQYHLRVAVRTSAENSRLVAVLREIGEGRRLAQEDGEA